MTLQGHQRRILLFVAAIIVPALVLVALSLQLLRQDRELAEKRLIEEQRRAVSEIRQEMLARLERIKLQELSALAARAEKTSASRAVHSAVVLVSSVEHDRLLLPWESSRAAEPVLADDPTFASLIQQGEQAELAERQPLKALEYYRQALHYARQPTQSAYAQLLLARAYSKTGQSVEAEALYRKLLALPAELRDEQGITFWLYAAERLLLNGREPQTVLERLAVMVEDWRLQPPAELYLCRELADRLTRVANEPGLRERATTLQQRTAQALQQVEQALALQSDLPSLLRLQSGGQTAGLKAQPPEPLWLPYGADLWLVSLMPSPGTPQSAVIVVRAQELFATLDAANGLLGRATLFIGNGEQGEPLGASFPGLRVSFKGRADQALARRWNLQRAIYVAALLLVLSGTLFGAYLFWRDVRRELYVAELRSQFVSSVSHELKTPLTAIRMFAETLRLGRTTDKQTQAEYLDTIVNESERLTRLLNNVLDFSKIEQGKKTYQLAPLALADVVRVAARALEYPLVQQGFTLRVEIDDSLPAINADGDALQQAMLNLLTNAMKYSGASREIALRLRQQEGWAVIEVEDQGLGIAPSEQARIFEKFYRVQTPETKTIPGTGLGLTLVTHVAIAHGGRVVVRSALGAGSTFSLYLPLEA